MNPRMTAQQRLDEAEQMLTEALERNDVEAILGWEDEIASARQALEKEGQS